MSERVRDERSEDHAPISDLAAQVTQREHLISAQQPVTQGREAQSGNYVLARDLVQMSPDAADVEVRHLVVQDPYDTSEYQQCGNGADPTEAAAVVRACCLT